MSKRRSLIVSIILGLLLVMFVFAAPSLDTVTLTSSDGDDTYLENLTITTDQDANASVKLIYDWYKDGSSVAVLNMPFEADGDQNATDYSSYENDGTVSGTTWGSIRGYDGKGAHYFGYYENDEIEIDYNESLNLQNFSIAMWVNVDQFNDWSNWIVARPYHCDYDNNPPYEYGLTYFTGNGIEYFVDGSYQCTYITLSENTWYHLALLHNGTNMMLYVDGVLRFTGTGDSSINYENNCGIRLGTSPSGGSDFNGLIDDLLIFDYVISAEQIVALNNSQTDLLVSQETSTDDQWKAEVTPNDGSQDGTSMFSNTITILEEAAVPEPPTTPEFPDYAMAISLMVIVGGFFFMKKNED